MPVELESWFQKRSANLKTELNQDPTRRSLNSGRCQRATIMMTMAQLIMSAVGVSYGGISNSHCRLMSRRKNRAQEPGVCQLWRWWCAVGLGVQLANDPGLETIQVFGGPDRHNFRAWPRATMTGGAAVTNGYSHRITVLLDSDSGNICIICI